MADFSNLKQKKLQTAEFTFFDVVGEPALTVRQAGEANKPYFNEQLKRADQMARRKMKVNEAMVREARDKDRELFAKFVVVGWRDVKDASDTEVKFSPSDCLTFFQALDDYQFDQLREFCKDETNFRDTSGGEVSAGNSQTA